MEESKNGDLQVENKLTKSKPWYFIFLLVLAVIIIGSLFYYSCTQYNSANGTGTTASATGATASTPSSAGSNTNNVSPSKSSASAAATPTIANSSAAAASSAASIAAAKADIDKIVDSATQSINSVGQDLSQINSVSKTADSAPNL